MGQAKDKECAGALRPRLVLVSGSPSARNYPGWVHLPVESLTRSGGSSFQSLRPPLLCEADANWRIRNSMWCGRGPAAAKLSYSRVKAADDRPPQRSIIPTESVQAVVVVLHMGAREAINIAERSAMQPRP